MPAGRPTKYDPAFCDIFVEMSSRGCSKTEFCATVGISFESFTVYRKEIVEFSDAVTRGELLCQAWWEKIGREGAADRNFNSQTWQFNMINRFRSTPETWINKKEVGHTGSVTVERKKKRFDGD